MLDDTTERVCIDDAAMMLPWYAAGTLSAQETAVVETHLETCSLCKDDLKRQQHMRELIRVRPVVEYAPQPGLQQLFARIDDDAERAEPAPPTNLRAANLPTANFQREVASAAPSTGKHLLRWLAAAVAVQTIALGFLATSLWQRVNDSRAPNYTTLSAVDSVASTGQIRAVFTPATTLAELQSLCATLGVTVVAGPSDAGVYTLAIVDTSREEQSVKARLERLRADSHVLFAEPVSAER